MITVSVEHQREHRYKTRGRIAQIGAVFQGRQDTRLSEEALVRHCHGDCQARVRLPLYAPGKHVICCRESAIVIAVIDHFTYDAFDVRENSLRLCKTHHDSADDTEVARAAFFCASWPSSHGYGTGCYGCSGRRRWMSRLSAYRMLERRAYFESLL